MENEKKKAPTVADITEAQIILKDEDGSIYIGISRDRILLNAIAQWCKFSRCDKDLFDNIPLSALVIPE